MIIRKSPFYKTIDTSSRSVVDQEQKYESQLDLSQYYIKSNPTIVTHESKVPIYINCNLYQEIWGEIRTQNEYDQKISLYKIYRDLVKANTPIIQRIICYRRNHIKHINKSRDGRESSQISKTQGICDMKDITRIVSHSKELYRSTRVISEQ